MSPMISILVRRRGLAGLVGVALVGGCSDSGGRTTADATAASSGQASGTDTAAPTTTATGGSTESTDAGTSAGTGTSQGTSPTTGDGPTGPGTTETTDAATTGETDTGGAACEPPDMLIVLDRTLTMHRTPDGQKPVDGPNYASSKWYQAITAIEGLVQPPFDSSVRFGLELWPREPEGDPCVTLAQQVTGSKTATNPSCEPGEIAIDVGPGAGQAIIDLLDPATTRLCSSTPTGEALYTAGAYLEGIKAPGRDQYVLLVTDGADWANTCPQPDPLKAVQDLEAKGIKTFIVGFNGEEAQLGALGFLNNLACAGQTAKGFPGPCVETQDGWTGIAVDQPVPVYLQADDAAELTLALQSVIDDVCCGCTKGCDAPEVLFALDRTLTMHRTPDGATPADGPDYASSKWYQAVSAIDDVVTTPGLETELRLGLELWPRDPGGGQCVTLAQQVTKSKMATNPSCETGEIVVAPALQTGAAIDAALDPATTLICQSTPTGSGLQTAFDWMVDNATPGRDQYVVLVTDGADWDQTCPDPSPLAKVQQLAGAGIRTYVVGFFGAEAQGKAGPFLNELACAGQTATGFPGPCTPTPNGWQATNPDDPMPLYLIAGDGELTNTLTGVAAEIAAMCTPG